MLSNLVIGPEKLVLFVGMFRYFHWIFAFHQNNHIDKQSLKKRVFYTDHNAYEPIAHDLLGKLIGSTAIYHLPQKIDIPLDENDICVDISKELSIAKEKSTIILRAISRLELVYKIPDIIRLIHSIKRHSKTKQLFVWCSVTNIMDKKLIPFIAYMADIIVTLNSGNHLNVLTKRSTGSTSTRVIWHWSISKNHSGKNYIEYIVLLGISIRNR